MGSSPRPSEPSSENPEKSQRAPFERRIAGFSMLLVAPALLVSGVLIWLQPWQWEAKIALIGTEALVCLLLGMALRDHVVRPLQTLANVVGALREQDYSFRARVAVPDDALGELSLEVNMLTDLLALHRTGAVEATALLQRVVEEVDLPIFAFDPENKLRMVNSAGGKLMQRPSAGLLGRSSDELGLERALACENETLVSLDASITSSDVRWLVRRSSFRQGGVPHTLMVLSDVSRALREEERRAWQRLIRVMGHELNNSLAPIKSIAGSLQARLEKMSLDAEQQQDFVRGLGIIESRAASLNRFLQAYRQLAQMPSPALRTCSILPLVKRVAALETRVNVAVIPGPDVVLMADPDQLEQMFINLLRNAAEAVLEPAARDENESNHGLEGQPDAQVIFTWKLTEKDVILTIEDSGVGLMNPGNVFVPFYTTKPGGSGIGLLVSRQICEAHGGGVELANRSGQRGCVVKVNLPRDLSRDLVG